MRALARRAAVATLGLAAFTGCLTHRLTGLGVGDEDARTRLRAGTICFADRDDVWLARGDGSEAMRLITGGRIGRGGAVFLPTLAPGGRRLLFLSVVDLDRRDSTGRDLSLHIVDLEGAGPEAARIGRWRVIRLGRIAPPRAGGRQEIFTVAAAAWSRDGTQIGLGLNRSGPGERDAILLLGSDGAPTALYDLGRRDLSRVSSLSFTPDGGAIILGAESDLAAGDGIGLVLRLELGVAGPGGGPTITELGPGRYPTLSPDGSRIAVVDDRSGQRDLLLLDHEGREVERFVRLPGRGLSRPSWSDDGRYLYYYSLASTGPLGLVEITMLRCLDTLDRHVFDLARLG